MSIHDPIADMLTCIRNAQAIGNKQITMPFSRVKCEILRVMKEQGYINDYQMVENDNKKYVSVELKYYQGQKVIEKIKRISRPGLRIYRGYEAIPSVRGGLGIAIISTSHGVMADKQARTQHLGGEVICTVE
jgi:small subunit ribosomal protein S8